jgi:CrcB protein
VTKDGPLWLVVAAVASGAAVGAVLRWALSYWLNARLAWLPLGTLCANLLGCFAGGVLLAVFSLHPAVPPAVRLFAVTGLLGGLTTFSTFSTEALVMLESGALAHAAAHVALHVGLGIACAAAGWKAARALLL